MQLTGKQIKDIGLIQNGHDKNYRSASYDLRVGTIIIVPGEEKSTFSVPPQGMVEVVSRERVKLPINIAGYAMVKTGLSNQGVLAINIGIVDPGYEGLLSSTLINFSKSDFLLEKDDAFLRLTFHECSPDTTDQTPYPNQSDTSYTRAKKEKVSRHFSKTFLNLENTVREAMKDLQSEAIKFVALMAFVLAIFSMFVNLGSAVMGRYVGPRESPRPQPSAQVQDQDNKNLQERVQKLERETQQLIAESVDKTKKGKSVK